MSCAGCYNSVMDKQERFAKFWNVKLASEIEAIRRTQICKSCDRYISITSMCKECGCYMPFKTKLKNMSCPLNHWVSEADEPVNTGSSGDNNGNQSRPSTE